MTMLISGALIMGYVVAAGFFLRFWKETRDRLFALFGAAFLILALQRLLLAFHSNPKAEGEWLYGLRLIAFLVILAAIIDKNRVKTDTRN